MKLSVVEELPDLAALIAQSDSKLAARYAQLVDKGTPGLPERAYLRLAQQAKADPRVAEDLLLHEQRMIADRAAPSYFLSSATNPPFPEGTKLLFEQFGDPTRIPDRTWRSMLHGLQGGLRKAGNLFETAGTAQRGLPLALLGAMRHRAGDISWRYAEGRPPLVTTNYGMGGHTSPIAEQHKTLLACLDLRDMEATYVQGLEAEFGSNAGLADDAVLTILYVSAGAVGYKVPATIRGQLFQDLQSGDWSSVAEHVRQVVDAKALDHSWADRALIPSRLVRTAVPERIGATSEAEARDWFAHLPHPIILGDVERACEVLLSDDVKDGRVQATYRYYVPGRAPTTRNLNVTVLHQRWKRHELIPIPSGLSDADRDEFVEQNSKLAPGAIKAWRALEEVAYKDSEKLVLDDVVGGLYVDQSKRGLYVYLVETRLAGDRLGVRVGRLQEQSPARGVRGFAIVWGNTPLSPTQQDLEKGVKEGALTVLGRAEQFLQNTSNRYQPVRPEVIDRIVQQVPQLAREVSSTLSL